MGSLLGRCRYEVAMRMMGSVHCSRSQQGSNEGRTARCVFMNSALVLEPADNLVTYNELSYLFLFQVQTTKVYLSTYLSGILTVGSWECLPGGLPLHIVGHLKSINIPMLSYSIHTDEKRILLLSQSSFPTRIFTVNPSDLPCILLRDGFATGGLNFNLFFAKRYCLSKQKILTYTMVQFKLKVNFKFLAFFYAMNF